MPPLLSKTGIQRRIKQHITSKVHSFFSIVQPGFEKTSILEFNNLGISEITEETEGGFEFRSTIHDCWKLNLLSKTSNRIIMRIKKFKAENFAVFKKNISSIPWELYLHKNSTIKFSVSCKKSRLYHTGRLEEDSLSAIKERFSMFDSAGEDASEYHEIDQTIFIRAENNIFQVSIDSSGEILYKRGKKTLTDRATLRETTAAAILLESGISDCDILIDPMCGSGTFSMEAAGIWSEFSGEIDRQYAFMGWPSFKEGSFNHIKNSLIKKTEKSGRSLYVYDKNQKSADTAKKNLESVNSEIKIFSGTADFFKDTIAIEPGKKYLVVINPPYGKRIETGQLKKIYNSIGAVIRAKYPYAGYAIIAPGLEMEKALSLSYEKKIKFINGGIPVAVIIKRAC